MISIQNVCDFLTKSNRYMIAKEETETHIITLEIETPLSPRVNRVDNSLEQEFVVTITEMSKPEKKEECTFYMMNYAVDHFNGVLEILKRT